MSIYQKLRTNPPKIEVKENAREVIFNTISCMCDNSGVLKFKKAENGDFKVSGGISAISNWDMKSDVDELLWAADDQNWDLVVSIINSGTTKVQKVRSR